MPLAPITAGMPVADTRSRQDDATTPTGPAPRRCRPFPARALAALAVVATLLAALIGAGFPISRAQAETGGSPAPGSGSAPASGSPLSLEVLAGYGQQPAGGPWIPASITITNSGSAPFRGTLEVAGVEVILQGPFAGMPPAASPSALTRDLVRWRHPVEVPAGARRTLTVPVPTQGGITVMSLEARLLDEDGDVAAWSTVPVPGGAATDIRVALLAPRDIPYLAALPAPRGGHVTVDRIDPQLAPRTAAGWANFDLVVLDGAASWRDLDAAQQATLALWVQLGGTLLVGTGPDAGTVAASLGPELFPWKVAGSVTVDTFPGAVTWARRLEPDVPPPGRTSAVAAILRPLGGAEPGTGTSGNRSSAPGLSKGQGESDEDRRARAPSPGAAPPPSLALAGPQGAAPAGYVAQAGAGRVYAWSTRLDAEPWLSWSGTPAALAAWLGADLRPATMRQADLVWASYGMGSGPVPGTSGRTNPVPYATALDAGGPPFLFRTVLGGLVQLNIYTPHTDALLTAVGDLPGLQFPGPAVLLLGFAAYLVLVGPVTFHGILRRRRPLAWIVVPALAGAVIAGSYVSGILASRDTPRTAAGFLLLDAGGTRGSWSGLIAAYRPGATAAVTAPAGALVVPVFRPQGASLFSPPSALAPTVEVEPAAAGQRVRWARPGAGRVDPVTVQFDLALKRTEEGPGLVARATPAGEDRWRLQVVNGLDVPLAQVAVLQGDRVVHHVGDLAPGQAAEAVVRIDPTPPPPSWPPGFGGPTLPAGSGGGSGAQAQRQHNHLRQAIQSLAGATQGGVVLVAGVEGTPVLLGQAAGGQGAGGQDAAGEAESGERAGSAGADRPAPAAAGAPALPLHPPSTWDRHGFTLVVAPVQVDPLGGAGAPPSSREGAAPGPPSGGPSSRTSLAGTGLWPLEATQIRAQQVISADPQAVVLENGTVELEWRPPEAVAARARRLRLTFDHLPSRGPGSPLVEASLDLYDFTAARWVTVKAPGVWEAPGEAPPAATAGITFGPARLELEGPALGRFLPPGGRLSLRLRGPDGAPVMAVLPRVELEVTP